MRAAGEPLIDFSIGDPREPTPEFIREALRQAVPEVSQYPTTAGLSELRGAVAGYVKRRFGVEVDPESQVLPVAGSKEAIFSTPLAFVDRDRGDTVVWATPGYPIYERGALLAGAKGHQVRLGGDFVLRAADIPEEILDRASLVWTCSPHNPTGSVTSRDDMAGLHAAALASGALLCADECYADLFEDDPPASVLQVSAPSLEGVLSYLSLSKRSGMTGYRSGVIVGDAAAIALLRALRTSTGTASPEFVRARRHRSMGRRRPRRHPAGDIRPQAIGAAQGVRGARCRACRIASRPLLLGPRRRRPRGHRAAAIPWRGGVAGTSFRPGR